MIENLDLNEYLKKFLMDERFFYRENDIKFGVRNWKDIKTNLMCYTVYLQDKGQWIFQLKDSEGTLMNCDIYESEIVIFSDSKRIIITDKNNKIICSVNKKLLQDERNYLVFTYVEKEYC